ncbi:MAG: DUF4418 family protein [Treponema sp.]|jgi:CHASE2 domain-containing sensor protein|nr:DUF4418 family protein [Treponema sp.]
MKKQQIYGIIIILLGLFIALGPQFLFKVCAAHDGAYPLCHWSARAEMGMGMLAAALGLCLLAFSDPKTQLGLTIGIFLTGIIVIGIPHALIGGCSVKTMACRRIAFPVLTIEGIILLAYSAGLVVYFEMKKPSA